MISLIAIPENATVTNTIEIRNISIGQSYKKIVILVVLNLIMNIKFYLVWLLIIFATVSCDTNNVRVSDSEIESASAWSINDQPPTFPQCENLKNNEHLDCFKNIIEVEINSFLNDKVFPADTSEFIFYHINQSHFFFLNFNYSKTHNICTRVNSHDYKSIF